MADFSNSHGEYVLDLNFAPQLGVLTLSADMISEHASVSLAGSYINRNVNDSHTVVVDWDDPNEGDVVRVSSFYEFKVVSSDAASIIANIV